MRGVKHTQYVLLLLVAPVAQDESGVTDQKEPAGSIQVSSAWAKESEVAVVGPFRLRHVDTTG